MIKNVIFDLSEVLLRGLYGTDEIITKTTHIKVSMSDLDTPELKQFFRGVISESDMWLGMSARRGWGITARELKRLVRRNFGEIPGTRGVITDLRKQGYRLGLLSVHGREWIRHLEEKYRYTHLFDHLFYSCHSGHCKPDPEAFNFATATMGCTPQECLFVDDLECNTNAAAGLGFETHRFTSAEALRADLMSRGLL